jgi:hypothetical protein
MEEIGACFEGCFDVDAAGATLDSGLLGRDLGHGEPLPMREQFEKALLECV